MSSPSANASCHLETIKVGEHYVEHDEVESGLLCHLQGSSSGTRDIDVESLVAKDRRHRVDNGRLVIDDENPRCRAGPLRHGTPRFSLSARPSSQASQVAC